MFTRQVDLRGWVHGYDSLSPQLNNSWSEVAVLERLFPALHDMSEYKDSLRRLTMECNNILFDVIEDTARFVRDGEESRWNNALLRERGERLCAQLFDERDGFIFRHQKTLANTIGLKAERASA